MIVAFCGHSDFQKTDECEKKLLGILEELVGDSFADMYLGDYGAFDRFAYECCKKYKEGHPNIKSVFVTPYLSGSKLEHRRTGFDKILYPEIEDKPKKFAIAYRNKYMVEQADLVIAYVERSFGGAYTTYKHAKKKGKAVINLASFEG